MLYKKGFLILSIMTSFISCPLLAQNIEKKDNNLDIKIESAGVLSHGDYAPFWLINNNYGIGSDKLKTGYLRVDAKNNLSFLNNDLKLTLGADALVARNLLSDVYIQQLYGDLKYKNVSMSIGQKQRGTFFRNNSLSVGGFTTSINTRPMPQLEFSIPDFIYVPYSKNSLYFMAGLSNGFYTDNKFRENYGNGTYVKDVLYMHRYAFLKWEKPNSKWNFIFGVEAGTQWGGDRYVKNKYQSTSPHKFKDFFRVLFGKQGDSSAAMGDQINKLGDTYGSYHIIFNYKFAESNLKLYYEHLFEDRSGIEYKNYADGLYSIEYSFNKKQLVSNILFEFIYTRDHSGRFRRDENGNLPVDSNGNTKRYPLSAEDNYNNNYFYVSRQNNGFTLGNPLFTSPIYNNKNTLTIANNCILAYHLGLSGYFKDNLSYRALVTYSRAYATPDKMQKRADIQFSTLAEVNYSHPKLSGWLFSGAFAYDDAGSVVGNNIGGQLKISKTFSVK